MNTRTVLAIARKDILDAIKNRYLLMSMVLPVGMSVVFRILFTDVVSMSALQVAVCDPGGSRLTAQLRALSEIKLVEVESVDRLQEEVGDDAVGGLFIPEDFDAEVDLGEQPELTIYMNSRKGGAEQAIFQEIIYQQVWMMREDAAPVKFVWSEAGSQPGEDSSESGNRTRSFQMDSYLLVMFLVMSLAMTGSFVVPLLLVEEKEKHTMEFLLVAPVAPAEIAAGKALTGLVYSGLGAGILIALNEGWKGNWPLTVLAAALGAMFLVMVGLLMGSLLRTTMQINTWSTIVVMVLLAPSWLGVVTLPAFLDTFVRFIPTYYLAKILEQSLAGRATLADSVSHLAVIAAGAAVTFAIVVWVLRRQEN
jgi:ABC-type Na+ efflux pump permease subunit